ncbi:MAG TPA: heavy metal-responsive transcriptional regulator [Verrucomicrobiae bacterium]|nr:heavy metal-responsive transcriptional regulator [Verrucomicrobiae bacterium]
MSQTLEKNALRAGELARQTGVGVQTLHYYERIGLLPKPDRSLANYRLYPPAALRRVRFIKKAQAAGFTLDQIREILELQKSRAVRCHRVIEIGKKRLREIDAQLDALKAFRESLATALPAWEKDTARRKTCAGEFCDLIERLPVSAASQLLRKKPRS